MKARGGAGGGRNQRWTVAVACQCTGAFLLFSGALAACTAATRFADVAALAIAEFSTTEALCCVHDPFAVLRLVSVRGHGAYARFRCVGAALLLSGARAACTAATGFADVAALAMPSLSTTEAFAARTIRLLCRGLFSCVAIVHLHDSDA